MNEYESIYEQPYRPVKDMSRSDLELELERWRNLWTWIETEALRSGSTNRIIIERKNGTFSNSEFNSISDMLTIEELDILEESEKCVFVPATPPDIYVLERLFSQIFPGIFSQEEKKFIPFDDIVKESKSYYITWARNQGAESQIRSGWIRRGLEILEELDLVEKNDTGEYYVKFWLTRRTKNIKKFLIQKLCEKTIDNETKKLEEEKKRIREEKQQQLDKFLMKNQTKNFLS